MVRDGVANIVVRLRQCGFDPRRVSEDAWELRCPGHRSAEYALSITRNEFNHAVLECRGTENCRHMKIIRALGFTNDHLYAETPDWLIASLKRVEIRTSYFMTLDAHQKNGADAAQDERGKRVSRGSAATAGKSERGRHGRVRAGLDGGGDTADHELDAVEDDGPHLCANDRGVTCSPAVRRAGAEQPRRSSTFRPRLRMWRPSRFRRRKKLAAGGGATGEHRRRGPGDILSGRPRRYRHLPRPRAIRRSRPWRNRPRTP